MIGTIFNLAKINEQFSACFLLLSLTRIASTLLDSLAYIESKTDATNDIEQTENNSVLEVQTIS